MLLGLLVSWKELKILDSETTDRLEARCFSFDYTCIRS